MQLPAKEIQMLKDELNHRLNRLRPEINNDVNEAASLGDIPENFPYDAAVARQIQNESRINDLEKIIINVKEKDQDIKVNKIELGCRIQLERSNGQILEVILVDEETMERNPRQGFITDKSPLGSQLIGKRVNDVIKVKAPAGDIDYKVVWIE